MDSGGTIPVSRTSTAVQIDEVLTALQSPVRADLSRLLESYGTALTHEPTAAEDVTQLPEVKGKSRRRSAQRRLQVRRRRRPLQRPGHQRPARHPAAATSRASSPSAGRAFGAFASRQRDLQGLIVNFDVFTGALANQSTNLSTTIHLLAPTLRITHASLVSLNRTLPPLRTYAIELQPGGRRAAGPDQRLETVPRPGPPAALRQGGGRRRQAPAPNRPRASPAPPRPARRSTLPQLNQLSLCTTQGDGPDRQPGDQRPLQHRRPNYREFLYNLVNFAGHGQNFDGNGPYARAQVGGGPVLVGEPNPQGNQSHPQRQDQLRAHDRRPARDPAAARQGSRR